MEREDKLPEELAGLTGVRVNTDNVAGLVSISVERYKDGKMRSQCCLLTYAQLKVVIDFLVRCSPEKPDDAIFIEAEDRRMGTFEYPSRHATYISDDRVFGTVHRLPNGAEA